MPVRRGSGSSVCDPLAGGLVDCPAIPPPPEDGAHADLTEHFRTSIHCPIFAFAAANTCIERLFRKEVPEVRAGSVRVNGAEGKGGEDEWIGEAGGLEAKKNEGEGELGEKGSMGDGGY
jgi:hypothetical protein